MNSSEREDWLARQVRAIAAMVARATGLRIAGAFDEARAELAKAHAELEGGRSELLRRADAATAALLLGSAERVETYARLLDEEAALATDPGTAAALRARAAALRSSGASRDGRLAHGE